MALDLTDLTEVKARVSELNGVSSYDTLLGSLISSVSARAERRMNRTTTASSGITETFDVLPRQGVLFLSATPVTAITSVKFDLEREFGASTALASGEYHVRGSTGALYLDGWPPVYGRRVCQVVYDGGMAADTSAFRTAYPDIAEAIAKQVAFLFQRRDQLGITTKSTQGEGITVVAQDWLPEVEAVLDCHRRRAHR